MRNFINLSSEHQLKLSGQFPNLLDLARVEEVPTYSYLAVSVFDQWLGREKSIDLLSNVPKEEQARRNALLSSFSKKLAQSTEVVNFKFIGKWKKSYPLFRGFTSPEAKDKYLESGNSHVSKQFFRVVLPEIDAVFFESWDDTNVFYLKDKSKIHIIKGWADSAGVHCLEK